MSSLVSDFIINPVARTVRRFSTTPFATDRPVQRFADDFDLDSNGDAVAVAECDGPSISFPGISFLRGGAPDIALGARSPPLLTPQRRRTAPPPERDSSSRSPPNRRSPSPPTIFEMDRPASATALRGQDPPGDRPPPLDLTNTDPVAASRELPANDGKMEMRRRLQSIQSSSLTFDEKRYHMQRVLTENYAVARAHADHVQAVLEGKIDASAPMTKYSYFPPTPRDFGFGASALEALKSWTGLDDEDKDPIQFSEDDARPTYVPRQTSIFDSDDSSDATEEHEAAAEEEDTRQELGCEHYKRNVRIQCADCLKWYTCRLCHDAVESHILPRQRTRFMLCMLCGHPQKASDTCTQCGETAAQYYCSICKLWSDDVNKHIYHCEDCGICRVGRGLEKDFFHCKTCCACISISTRDDHRCIERATDANCPICRDNMFSSPQTVIFMECGHPIHKACFNEHMKTSYRCPLCNKSITKMDALFLNLANTIKEQPMPEDWECVRSVILCNDCSAKSETPFHFLGLRCQICLSFNTHEISRSAWPGMRHDDPHSVALASPALPRTPSQSEPDAVLSIRALNSPGPHTMDANGLMQRMASQFPEPEINIDEDEDDEELDFWGGKARSMPSEDDEEDSGDEEEDSDSDEEYEEDDDNDEEEDIILFGHR